MAAMDMPVDCKLAASLTPSHLPNSSLAIAPSDERLLIFGMYSAADFVRYSVPNIWPTLGKGCMPAALSKGLTVKSLNS